MVNIDGVRKSKNYKQEVNGSVPQDEEDAAEDGKADRIGPQAQRLEAESRENRSSWHFDVKSVLVVFQAQISDFVDDESFEGKVEN